MHSIIAVLVSFSLTSTVALVQAQEIPETFLVGGDQPRDRASEPRTSFNKGTSGLYTNHAANCILLGHKIDPCE